MINISKMKLFPFKTSALAIPFRPGEKYNIIVYPENTSLIEEYYNLRLKRIYVGQIYIQKSKFPKVIITGSMLKPYRNLKLIPILNLQKNKRNYFNDTTHFLNSLDEKFGKGNYKRTVVSSKIRTYLNTILQIQDLSKKVFFYLIDLDKDFNQNIQYRRIFPVYEWLKRNDEIPFDYFLMCIISNGQPFYTLLSTKDNSLNISRILAIFKSLKPNPKDTEEEEDDEMKLASNIFLSLNNILPEKGKISSSEKKSIKSSIIRYLNAISSEDKKQLSTKQLDSDTIFSVVNKSILYNLTGDLELAENKIDNKTEQEKERIFNVIKENLLSDIVKPDVVLNNSRDPIIGKLNILSIVDKKEPSLALNKRKVDFENTFKKDLRNSFKLLEKTEFPLKISSMTMERLKPEEGDLNPTIYDKYSIMLTDGKKKYPVDVKVPTLHDDGTFMINGVKKFLIYQIILDPIYFIKKDHAKLETLYAPVSIHIKRTKSKKYFDIQIAGPKFPLFAILGYYLGFKKTCDLYNIRYQIVEEKPDKQQNSFDLDDGKYIIFSEVRTEYALLLLNSLKELQYKFTSENLEDQETFKNVIIKITKNRNIIDKLNEVLNNIMEPVAVQILRTKLLPYTFSGCVLYICQELAKGRVDDRNDLTKQRIRSSEIFVQQIQKLILASYNNFRTRKLAGDKDVKFFVHTDDVISDIVNSRLVRELENINPMEELSSMTRVTPIGEGGIPSGDSLTLKDRNVSPSYYGNLDPMDTPESANIGVLNQLTVGSALTNSRGSLIDQTKEEMGSGILSPVSALVPFISSTDGNRVMMSTSQTRQAINISGAEPPLVQTGYESILSGLLTDSYIKKTKNSGIISKVTDDTIYVKNNKGQIEKTFLDPVVIKSGSGVHALNHFTPIIKVGQKVKQNQILAEGKHIKDGVISQGTNLLTAVMGWKGFSYEDGYVVSDKVAREKFSSDHYFEIKVLIRKDDNVKFLIKEGSETKDGEPLMKRSSKEVEELITLEEDELQDGHIITKSSGGKVTAIEIYPNIPIKKFPLLVEPFQRFKKKYEERKGTFPKKFIGKVTINKEEFSGVLVVFKIEKTFQTELGDKLANSHGGKGVITWIEKVDNMPKTPWGDPIDIILNPLSIVNRMNPSTIYELHTGLIAKFFAKKLVSFGSKKTQTILSYINKIYSGIDGSKNKKYSEQVKKIFNSMSDREYANFIKYIIDKNYLLPIIIPPFQSPSKKQLIEVMKLVGSKPAYKLFLPEYKMKTLNEIAVGYLYFKKLEQQSAIKKHARAAEKYQSKILQPTAGGKRGGGQRVGEYDSWALLAHGANDVLREFFGPLSDDHGTKQKIIADIIQNGNAEYRQPKSSPTRDLLDVYMKGLMLVV